MSCHLLDELREVLGDNSKGFAAHSKVIVLLMSLVPLKYTFVQVDLHSLEERGGFISETRFPESTVNLERIV